MSQSMTTQSHPLAIHAERGSTPREFRRMALDAVEQLNTQFLTLVCVQAAAQQAHFFFQGDLRTRFATLAPEERERLAKCGTLLIDFGAQDSRLDSGDEGPEVESVGYLPAGERWLPAADALWISHATVLFARTVLSYSRAEASVLLGMSPEIANMIAGMRFQALSSLAERHAGCVRLRWHDAPAYWEQILDLACSASREVRRLLPLRCLQLPGGYSDRLTQYLTQRAQT